MRSLIAIGWVDEGMLLAKYCLTLELSGKPMNTEDVGFHSVQPKEDC
jgi:hypothetical protein